MTDSVLVFAGFRQEREWDSGRLHPMARKVALLFAWRALTRWGWMVRVTSVYRSPEEDRALEGTGIHPAWRAVDIGGKEAPPGALAECTEYVNARFVYDPDRPALLVVVSKPHGTGPHAHCQAHDHTVERPAA